MSATLAMERERPGEPNVLPFALTLAIGAHAAIAILTPAHAELPEPPPAPLEVELNAPKPEPPRAEPPRPEPTAPAPAVPRVMRAPARAAAGRLLAAEPSPLAPVNTPAPLDFVTDPNGKGYGFGVVSRGGTALGEGVKTPVPGPTTVVAAPAAPALANAADLSEKPRLLADDPCRGFYPAGAGVDSAAAVVRVVIEPSGRVREVTLLSEAPAGEGFGAAARQCIRRQRFSAPRDQEGRAVATATTIRVRFDR